MTYVEVSHAGFNTINDYEADVTGYQKRSLQLDRGRLYVSRSEIRLPDLVVRRYVINRTVEDTRFSKPDWTTFAMTSVSDGPGALWCGCRFLTGAIGRLDSGREQHFVMPAGWDCIEIDVPDRVLIDERLVPEQLLKRAKIPESGEGFQLNYSRYRFPVWLKMLLGDAERLAKIQWDPDAARKLHRHTLNSLSDAIAGGLICIDRRSKPRPVGRYALVRRAQSRIAELLPDCPNIEFIAADLGSSSRTLERAFQDVLRISPYQYQLRLRLDVARRELLCNSYAATVQSIADRHGFSSGSQFSDHYSRMFGETPSTTLHRNR